MNKLFVIVGTCLALSACIQTDVDEVAAERAERLNANQATYGCQFTDDHASYRNCLMNTYYKSKPKTFVTGRKENGKSLAIVRNESTSSYDEKTGAYKTERVIVIETEEQLVPLDVVNVKEKNIEKVTIPEPKVIVPEAKEKPVPEIVFVPEVTEVVKVQEKADPVTLPKETWWERHKKENVGAVSGEVSCPCEDPNDFCPQCFDK